MRPLLEALVDKSHHFGVVPSLSRSWDTLSRYVLGSCQSGMTRGVFLNEGENPAGRTAVRFMAQEPEDIIISSYTDAQVLGDGVLVAWDDLQLNRVTRAVFDHFTSPMGSSPLTGVVIDITPLRRVIQTMLAVEADGDGWRVGAYEGKELWLVPNEVSGLTLMFPEDY
jgi:hypothetical protein